MRILLVSFSQRALTEGQIIKNKWLAGHAGDTVEAVYGGSGIGAEGADCVSSDDVKAYIEAYFSGRYAGDRRAVIFISSCGIAVRMISPYLIHKACDPAVLVMDELGKHCISLLSGHLGGANELCREVAGLTGAEAVITTASDLSGSFSPDMYAAEHGLAFDDFEKAKLISAASVAGEEIGIVWDDGLGGETVNPDAGYGVFVAERAVHSDLPFANTLVLYPRNLIVGVGCRRNTPADVIIEKVNECLQKHGLLPCMIRYIASADIKKNEQGIIELADRCRAAFVTFDKEELLEVERSFGPSYFSASEFVREVSGVGCVCEESVMACGADELLVKKTVYDKVTVAIGRISHCAGTAEM